MTNLVPWKNHGSRDDIHSLRELEPFSNFDSGLFFAHCVFIKNFVSVTVEGDFMTGSPSQQSAYHIRAVPQGILRVVHLFEAAILAFPVQDSADSAVLTALA